MSNTHVGAHPMIPRFIRLFSVPILLGWLALTVIVDVVVPQRGVVGEAHAVSLAPNDARSLQAMQRIGKDFKEFDSNSSAMIVLEGDQPLGDGAHKFYDGLINRLEADKKHVEHIQDFWGDPLTASGAQRDRKSTRLNSSHLGISYAVFCLKNTHAPARRCEQARHVLRHPGAHLRQPHRYRPNGKQPGLSSGWGGGRRTAAERSRPAAEAFP